MKNVWNNQALPVFRVATSDVGLCYGLMFAQRYGELGHNQNKKGTVKVPTICVYICGMWLATGIIFQSQRISSTYQGRW